MSEPQFLTVAQVAAFLDIGQGSVKRWIAVGVLPSVKLGRHRRVSRRQLEDFLAQLERDGSVPPAWPHSKRGIAPMPSRRAAR